MLQEACCFRAARPSLASPPEKAGAEHSTWQLTVAPKPLRRQDALDLLWEAMMIDWLANKAIEVRIANPLNTLGHRIHS